MPCLFCEIAAKEKSADIVWEDDDIVVFKDIYPKAPVHLLVVPKKHIESVNHAAEADEALLGKIVLTAKRVAEKLGFAEKGYKLEFHVGRGGGQLVDHIHMHILSW
ncbi:histidine triad nucleotide-binding protein [Candidatus Azambacteria bacterium]|nr:histidine triad nucleotide-binding protein [Candidatus Azambacteria bacterium]